MSMIFLVLCALTACVNALGNAGEQCFPAGQVPIPYCLSCCDCVENTCVAKTPAAPSCQWVSPDTQFGSFTGRCTVQSACVDGWRTNSACTGGTRCCVKPACKTPTGEAGVCTASCSVQSFKTSEGATGCQAFRNEVLCCPGEAQPPVVEQPTNAKLLFEPNSQMKFNPATSKISALPTGELQIVLRVPPDNNNEGLPGSFRYWYYFGVEGLPNDKSTTLKVRIPSSEQWFNKESIRPVFSLDGGKTFQRQTGFYSNAGNFIAFDIVVPPGNADSVRIAKFYPYPIAKRDAFFASLASSPHIKKLADVGTSNQGRALQQYQIGTGPRTIWIHAGAHPAETTSYYVTEGLVQFLIGDSELAQLLRERCTVYLMPMANPDGVALGNARTNAQSQNMEEQYLPPFDDNTGRAKESLAIKTKIEEMMAAATAKEYPIEVLLNLHSTHVHKRPFHFRHTADAVGQAVHDRENRWINTFKENSPIVKQGTTLSSRLLGRKYVESFMNDKYTKDAAFNVSIMAITFEGTYYDESDSDYVTVGQQMGQALAVFTFPACNSQGARCEVGNLCKETAVADAGRECPPDKLGNNGGFVCCADATKPRDASTPVNPNPQPPVGTFTPAPPLPAPVDPNPNAPVDPEVTEVPVTTAPGIEFAPTDGRAASVVVSLAAIFCALAIAF